VHFLVEGEIHQLRLQFEQIERTWENGLRISEVPLATIHEWRSVGVINFLIEVPISL
jgi:hypothetical protein